MLWWGLGEGGRGGEFAQGSRFGGVTGERGGGGEQGSRSGEELAYNIIQPKGVL